MALVLALLTKVGLLAMLGSVEGLPEGWFDWTEAPFASWYVAGGLIAAHSVSRALSLVLIAALPHVGDTAASRSKPLADQISPASLLAAFLWCFMALALAATALDASYLIAASSFSFIAMLWMGSWFKRRLQGFTGDCLGATQQVCEIAFYLGLAVCL
jgi:adenosylcobinamide-GDP ribazoletransferase